MVERARITVLSGMVGVYKKWGKQIGERAWLGASFWRALGDLLGLLGLIYTGWNPYASFTFSLRPPRPSC